LTARLLRGTLPPVKLTDSRYQSGIGMASLLPWLLGVAGLLIAALAWLRPVSAPETSLVGSSDAQELARLRSFLVAKTAENEGLRRELDRLGSSRSTAAASGVSPADRPARAGQTAASPWKAPSDEERKNLVEHLHEALARATAGDPSGKEDFNRAVLQLLRSGPLAFGTLRDLYVESADAKARGMLIPAMVFSRAPEIRDFVIDQVQGETDPELKRTLMEQAARLATSETANTLQDTFAQAIRTSEDPQTRIAAARGLRYAGAAEASVALFQAAADPDEQVRIAAIDSLASRPGAQAEVQKIAANDPSPRIREFAQCRLLVAKEVH
jgi:hypothetical protein